MLYTLSYQGNDGTFELPVCVQAKDKSGNVVYHSAKELLTDKDLILSLRHQGITLGVKYLEGIKKPMVISVGNNKTQSVSKFLGIAKKCNYKSLSKDEVSALFGGKLQGPSLDNVYEIFRNINKFVILQTQPIKFKLDVPNNIAVDANTIKAIQEINNSQTQLEFIEKGLNENKFMSTCQDEVFIKLLTYGELKAEVVSKPFPSSSTIYTPYRTNAFRMPFYQNKLLPSDDRNLIEGTADNNDLAIQPNEETFYKAMCELIDYGIKQEYPDVTIEQARKDGISSKVVREYLIRLAVEVCKWNWLHTGFLEFDIDFDDDNDEDDANSNTNENADETDATLGNATFLESETNKRGESGSFILTAYIERASKTNIYAPCEAVIKLLRWGDRKPTRLKLEGMDRYLILKTFTTSQLSGSLSNLEVIKEGTKQYRPKQLVMAYGSFQDTRYLNNLKLTDDTLNVPVGLVCEQQFVGGQSRDIYFSMIDVINDIEQNRNEIFDLEKDSEENIKLNMEFGPDNKVGLSDVIIKVNNDINSLSVYNTADEIKDLFLKYKANVSKASYLTVWHKFINMNNVIGELESTSFEDEEDFKYKVSSTGYVVKSYLESNIAKATLPILLEVASKCEDMRNETGEPSISTVINLYSLALLKTNIVDIMNPTQSKADIDNKLNALTNKISKMNAFEEMKEEPAKEVETPKVIEQDIPQDLFSSFIVQPKATDVIYDIKHKDSTVGQVSIITIDEKKKYLFMQPGECPYPSGNKVMQLPKLILGFVNDYYFVLNKESEKCVCRFYSKDTLKYYRNLLSKVI